MHRFTLILLVLLTVACVGYAQTSSSTPPAPPAGSAVAAPQPAQPGTVLPPEPGTTATDNAGNVSSGAKVNTLGVAGIVGTAAPGAVTPEIQFVTVMPPAGATSNMPGTPAGATSSPAPLPASAPMTYSVGVQRNAVREQPSPSAASEESMALDLSGAVFVGATAPQEAVDNRSLGEIAAQYKRNRATQNARVITNEDIARLNARSEMNVMGTQDNAALPQGEEAAPADAQQPQPLPKGKKHSPFAPKLPK